MMPKYINLILFSLLFHLLTCWPHRFSSKKTHKSHKSQKSHLSLKSSLLFPESFSPYKPLFSRSSLPYTAFHCDRNIYKLCQKLAQISKPVDGLYSHRYYAVIVTNKEKMFLIRQGTASKVDVNNRNQQFWNYHVVLIHKV